MFALCNLAHFALLVMTDGEKRLLQLPVVYLCKEVGLILHGVGTRREPLSALLVNLGLRIVTRSDEVVLVSALLVKRSELDESVAHHVRVRREARTHLVHRVARHLVPILAVAVNHLQFASEASRHGSSHFEVFLRSAVPFLLLLGTYPYIEAVGVKPALRQFVHHNRTVHAAREQHGYPLID